MPILKLLQKKKEKEKKEKLPNSFYEAALPW